MPGPLGQETIGERLNRLRAELARVRDTIARHENNGQSHNIGGAAGITEIAYERALKRQAGLEVDIATLEARLGGATQSSRIALTQTVR